MDEWADSLGTTANEYSKLTAAIRLTNKTAEQAASIAQGGLNAIAPSLKAAQTGDEAAQAKFQKHGIATNNADGSARDTVAVLKDLTGVLADLKNKGDVKGASELTQEFGLSQEFETFAKSLKGGAEAMAKFEEGAKRAVVQSDFQKDLNKKAGEIEARSQLANEEINAMVSTVTQTIAVGAGEVWTRMKEGVVALAKGDGGNPQKGQALYDNGDGTFSTAAADIKSAAENLKALESARSAERQVANIAGDRQASKGGAQSVEINTSSDVQANVQVSGLVTEAELRKKIEAELMPKIEAKIAKGMSLGGGNMLVTR
jgi:hypothetical protein